MKKLSITVPKPCHENWDKMFPEEKGKFCQSCAKTVIDFTKSSDIEITNYFQKNKEIKTCGRFNTNQLESIKIKIPQQDLFKQTTFRKAFLLALFVTMGTTLFSCKDSNNTVKTIGEIVVVEDNIIHLEDSIILPIKITEPKTKKGEVKCDKKVPKLPTYTLGITIVDNKDVEPVAHNEVIMGDVQDETTKFKQRDYYSLFEVDQKPSFPKGDLKFRQYIIENLDIPEGIENQFIYIEFIVDTKGKLTNFRIIKGKNEALNNNIIQILQNAPKWIPGKIKDESVNVKMNYPIRIKID